MGQVTSYEFGPFRLDVPRRRLLRGDQIVALTSRTFDTLLALIECHGQVADKDHLMRAVWADTAVEESNLTQQISLLRKALGEHPTEHIYIATAPRRGYRFVAPVRAIGANPALDRARAAPRPHLFVGRAREQAALDESYHAAVGGRGSMLWLAGEPGVGKTAIVEAFAERVLEQPGGWIARGRCSERLAGSDAYLPMLEALESLLSSSPDAAARMRSVAPAWLAQIEPHSETVATPPPSQQRLKRELTALMASLSKASAGVLFLDDLQWVDESTADLIAYLAARVPAMRLLILCTSRSNELHASHPFVTVTLDLQARGICREVPVDLLSREDVNRLLESVLGPEPVPAPLTELLHSRTEGNPLFLTELVRDLRERGVLAVDPVTHAWALTRPLSEVGDWPRSLRSMVERAISRVPVDARAVLTTASVQGLEFDSLTVSRALDRPVVEVEEQVDWVDRHHGLVQKLGELRFPGGEGATRYAFVHVLYQNALHAALSRSRRAALCGAVGDAMRVLHASQSSRVAHQLAHLYAGADRPSDAIEQLHVAAKQALHLAAPKEAVVLTRRALALLAQLPEGLARDRNELTLLITLGVPLAATTGYANPDVERTYSRTRELAERIGDGECRFAALWGLWVLYHVRAELRRARETADELLNMGQESGDQRVLQVAHTVSGYTIGHMGEFALALEHLAAASRWSRPDHHAFFASINALDPAVAAPAQEARLLCLLGEFDAALARATEAMEIADRTGNPNSRGFALVYAAYVHQMRGEPAQVLERTRAALALATEHGLADVYSWGTVWSAWARARTDSASAAESIGIIRQALEAQRSFGSEIARPHQLALLADVLALARRHDEALTAVDEGLAVASATGDRYYEPELQRLRKQIASSASTQV